MTEVRRSCRLSHFSVFSYSDYSEERLVATTNADLPNTLGNLLQRISTPRLNPGGPRLQFHPELFPTFEGSNFHCSPECRASEEDFALIRSLQNLPGEHLPVEPLSKETPEMRTPL